MRTAATDAATGGYLYSDGTSDGQWHHLSGDLSQFAGETVSYALAGLHYWMPNGTFDMYYANAGVVHPNGSVTPIFVGQGAAVAGFSGNTCGGQQETSGTEMIAVSDPMVSTTYVLNDHLGSEVGTMSSSGMVLSTLDYGPYGQVLSGTSPDGFIYTGLQRDASGLDHATMRQYSSVTGRWTTPDPDDGSYDFSNPQSLNRYAYVGNTPLRYTDPSGETIFLPSAGSITVTATAINPVPTVAVIAVETLIDIIDIGDIFGWWGGGPSFQGNIQAQHSGKFVRQCISDCGSTAPNDPTSSPSGPGLQFVANCEGFSPNAYPDSRGNCTIGYGHLLHQGACTAEDNALTVTQPAALAQFTADANSTVAALNRVLSVPLTQSQYDALFSLSFNMGVSRLQTHDVWRDVTSGNMTAVPSAILSLSGGGPGMAARRANEANMFSHGDYADACYVHP